MDWQPPNLRPNTQNQIASSFLEATDCLVGRALKDASSALATPSIFAELLIPQIGKFISKTLSSKLAEFCNQISQFLGKHCVASLRITEFTIKIQLLEAIHIYICVCSYIYICNPNPRISFTGIFQAKISMYIAVVIFAKPQNLVFHSQLIGQKNIYLET